MTAATPHPPHPHERRNVGLLVACQALFMTGQSMLIILSGLVGVMLAPDPALATLPVSAVVVGTTLTTIPASLLMKRVGRRPGFMLAAVIGSMGAATAAWAIYLGWFWLFTLGTLIIGINAGFSQYYRFAAADAAGPAFKARAVSYVVAGGIVAAIAGPSLAKWTADLFAPITFMGAYVTVACLALITTLVLSRLDLPHLTAEERRSSGRPLGVIMRQPVFVVAVLGAMVGYGVMSLVMTATPLAMVGCGFDRADAADVIRWHILAMFVPSLFTGNLIQRFGVLQVMMTGVALLGVCAAFAVSGVELANFSLALVALGLGWNFTFVGASTLLTETYEPAERAKTQAANDFLVFGTVATASLSSGAVLHLFDWFAVNWLSLPFVAIAGTAMAWLFLKRRAGAL